MLDEAEELGLTFEGEGQIYKGKPLGQIKKSSVSEEKDEKDSHSNETREDLDDDEDED